MDANIVAAHELCEEPDDRNEPGHRRGHLFVRAVYFEALIIEDDLAPVGARDGIDAQRKVALVPLHPGVPRQDERTLTGRTGRSDDPIADPNRL